MVTPSYSVEDISASGVVAGARAFNMMGVSLQDALAPALYPLGQQPRVTHGHNPGPSGLGPAAAGARPEPIPQEWTVIPGMCWPRAVVNKQ